MIPDLIPLTEIRAHIISITGVLVSKYAVKKWVKNGEITMLRIPGKREKYTTRKELLKFIERYTIEEEGVIEEELKIYLK